MMAHRYRHENFLSHVIPFHHLMLLFISYYSRTCLLGHLYSGYSSIQGHKIWSRKNVHIIFVFVTSIEGIPLYSGARDTFPGSRNPGLTSIRETPDHKNRYVTHAVVMVRGFRCECCLPNSFFLFPRKVERG